MVCRPLATLSIGPCAGVVAQHPPFMPCARCHVYTFRRRLRSELRSGEPGLEWGGRFAHDFVVPNLYWYRQCSPTCEANAALASLRDARADADHAIWRLEMAKRNLQVRYVSLDLALSRVDNAEGLQAWGWDSWWSV